MGPLTSLPHMSGCPGLRPRMAIQTLNTVCALRSHVCVPRDLSQAPACDDLREQKFLPSQAGQQARIRTCSFCGSSRQTVPCLSPGSPWPPRSAGSVARRHTLSLPHPRPHPQLCVTPHVLSPYKNMVWRWAGHLTPQPRQFHIETQDSFHLQRLSFQVRSRSEAPGGREFGGSISTSHTPSCTPGQSLSGTPDVRPSARNLPPSHRTLRTPPQTCPEQTCVSQPQTPPRASGH